MKQLPALYLSSKTLFNSRVYGIIMGEEKNVLDVAKLPTNRYAFEVTANLENFLLYVHHQGSFKVVSCSNPAEDEAMRIVNITNAILSWFLLSFGLRTYSLFDISVWEREWWIMRFSR